MALLKGAAILREARPEAVLRVYLAADLEFLIADLVAVGCEVYLMKSSSIRHNPGALWRFLALEETGRWVTVIDADLGTDILSDVERTEQAMAADLGLWRTPYFSTSRDMSINRATTGRSMLVNSARRAGSRWAVDEGFHLAQPARHDADDVARSRRYSPGSRPAHRGDDLA